MKSTIKTIFIVALSMLLVFSATLTLLTFGLLDCWGMNDLRELIARDILLEEMSKIEIEDSTVTENEIDTEVVIPETSKPDASDSKIPQTSVTEEPEKEKVEPLCIWNMNGIKITCLYLDEDATFGTVVKFQIENNTDNNIRVRIDNVTVNGYTLSLYGWNCTVTMNRQAVEELTLLSSTLEECDITEISTVELDFVITDTDTYTTIQETPTIRITFE